MILHGFVVMLEVFFRITQMEQAVNGIGMVFSQFGFPNLQHLAMESTGFFPFSHVVVSNGKVIHRIRIGQAFAGTIPFQYCRFLVIFHRLGIHTHGVEDNPQIMHIRCVFNGVGVVIFQIFL